MEYLRGWRALRQDPQWMGKVGIGSLLTLSIPVVGQMVLMGWNSVALRRAISGQDSPLPRLEFDFDYLTKLLGVGFKPFLAQMLWSMPIVGVLFVGYCCMAGAVMGAAAAGSDAGGILGLLLSLASGLVMIGGMFLMGMVLQVGVLRAEVADDIGESLKLKEVLGMTRLLFTELLVGSFVLGLLTMVGGMFAGFTLYLALFPVLVVLGVINTYYRAELYRVYLEKGGEPLPVGPLTVERGDAALVQAPGAAPGQAQSQSQSQPQGGGWGPPPAQF
jgi:hypothetical protein